jgi:hypothetical protein
MGIRSAGDVEMLIFLSLDMFYANNAIRSIGQLHYLIFQQLEKVRLHIASAVSF